ncbi:MAG: integrase family protein, partial [Myxococcales bacterium]|nr:integrase family protein [Myxococcales bacterium]
MDGVQPGPSKQILWDSELKGFGLVVQPSGIKSYVVRYTTAAGRDRRLVLGRHGELTPDEARKRAAEVRAKARVGGDPIEERQQLRRSESLSDLVDVYRQRHLARLKLKTREEYERLLARDILPEFGSRSLEEISTGDVARWHAGLESPYAANRALAVLRSLFELAARWSLRDPARPNPCVYVLRNPEQGRERFLSDEELGRLGAALAEFEKREPRARNAVAAIRLLLLTGARRNEILRLRWEMLDRERSCAWLPDSKTGRRPLLLAAPAWEVLDSLRDRCDIAPSKGWVLPSARKSSEPLADVRKTFSAVCALA